MRILPKFASFAADGKEKILELSMNIFLCSGLNTSDALKLLSEKPIDKYWENFVGTLFAIATLTGKHTNKIAESGVWSKEKPAPKEFVLLLLKTMLTREITKEVRCHCLLSIIRSLQTIRIGLFRFLIPVDPLLNSFGDAVFPFDYMLPEYYKELFELFGQGKLVPDSKWIGIFANSIRKELLKNRPEHVTSIIVFLSHIVYSRPEFVLSLVGDLISAIGSIGDLNFSSDGMDLVCCNLCELLSVPNLEVEGKVEMFQLIYSKILQHSLSSYNLLYITLLTKKENYKKIFSEILGRRYNPEIVLLFGFASHMFPSFVSSNVISKIIEKSTSEMHKYLTLSLIEILAYVETVRKDEQCIVSINDYLHNLENSLLRDQLANFVASPLRYQLNASDIEDILPRQRDYFKFNSTIVSSEFIDDERAIVVCRNKLSMSAYHLSPIPGMPSKVDEPSPLPLTPSENNPFIPYTPVEVHTRKRDTFYLLSAFGLFTQSNQYNITPLDENSIEQLKVYEANLGRKQYVISLTRLTSSSTELFGEKSSSTAFNEFTSKLGHFLQKPPDINGLTPTFSIPFYDTALFRFLYCSKLHFQEEFDPTKSFALIIFNESPAEVYYENHDFTNWHIVITIKKVMEGLYSMKVLKYISSIKAPFCNSVPRLVSSNNLSDEIAFILYSYVVSNIKTLYIKEYEENNNQSLFKSNLEFNGIELLSQIFGNEK
ncbi:hypothetical protein GPJ56_009772 [Histomonas meleagridis]|uniref:uncharacterized protein n=1 Tax=Histomonas meleagridis TaxID=135588 RepID=UPI003559B18E|nr:hypothetical protein GPJ56_009772 [Histomonas meleagridis]KAH0802334.1 hypothetical protein GO595_004947 [Histomonas meleagridis]